MKPRSSVIEKHYTGLKPDAFMYWDKKKHCLMYKKHCATFFIVLVFFVIRMVSVHWFIISIAKGIHYCLLLLPVNKLCPSSTFYHREKGNSELIIFKEHIQFEFQIQKQTLSDCILLHVCIRKSVFTL